MIGCSLSLKDSSWFRGATHRIGANPPQTEEGPCPGHSSSSRPTNSRRAKLDDERKRVPGLSDFIQENEPRLIAFNEYANQEGTEVKVVQVHPDTDSFEFHMGAVRERAEQAYAETR
jgi:hypothetical protein